jgi:hypothetical protein
MSKAGLDRKWIELIISHKSKLGASASYRDWEEIEEAWTKDCEAFFTWNKPTEIVKEFVDTQARKQNKFLLELFGRMLTPEQRKELDTMIASEGLDLLPVGTTLTPEKAKELNRKWLEARKRLPKSQAEDSKK